jgi:hypothetical protein
MRFSELYSLIKTQWLDAGPKEIFFLQSSPGIGKSALAWALGKDQDLGFDYTGDLNFSLLDTPDVAGLAYPSQDGLKVLQWQRSPLLIPFADGRNLCILEEMPDANVLMQNLGARLVYDRNVNGMKISDETFFLMLGNRSEDKSGAGRVSTKLSNRVCVLQMDAHLDDWIDNFALPNNLDPVLIQFLRFKPAVFSDFNPDAKMGVNPTPRAWERVARTSTKLSSPLYFQKVKGEVGEGPASEYAAFRKIYEGLVSFEEIVMNPTGVKVPTDPAVKYAIIGSVSHHNSKDNVERVAKFVERMTSEFQTMYWSDVVKKQPLLKATKPFISWATSSNNILLS